ncbi:Cof-type HAD-IIB family hydrolase [Chloroflexota bacterium]
MINNPYKLLVVDIDGTLLDKNGAISVEDEKALAKASDLGIQVSLSTGRVVKASLRIISQLSLDGYHMFFDGALVSNPETGEEVYVRPISEELLRQTIEFTHLNEINLDLYSATHFFVERETWVSDIRRQFFGIQPTIVDFSQLWQKERIIKGTLVVSSADERAKADSFCLHFKDSLSFSWTKTPAYPGIDFINVVDPDVSKGKALEALASFLGIALTEVIAIGDGTNDISLLSKAGLAIAMGNAPDEVKAVADYVTLDIDHNGMAAAVERFLL